MRLTKLSLNLCAGLMLSFALFGCATDSRVDDLQRELNKLKKELNEGKKKADEANEDQPFIKLTPEGEELVMDFYPGEERSIKVESKGLNDFIALSSNYAWTVNYDKYTQELTIKAPLTTNSGGANVMLSGNGSNSTSYSATLKTTLYDYSSPLGTFVLNEGSVWSTPSEMGSLIYISPRKSASANVYEAINGRAPGACTQDMFESGGKYFVIAQNDNSSTDGKLTIFDTKTLKKIGNYADELKELDWPTHVAVVDGYKIYIRDNKGIWFFDTQYSANKLTLIENTRGARKNVMAVSHGKVFFSANNYLKAIDSKTNKVVKEIKFDGNIAGVINADADHLYVACYANKVGGKIAKVNTETYEVVKENVISDGDGGKFLKMTFAAAPEITAKGDTLYYSSLNRKIYRHIFSTNTSKLMVDVNETINPDHKVTYNTVQVHPVTGLVYFNTLKGFGPDYKTNTIYRFDMSKDEAVLVSRWDNLTRFPAGIFFPRGN